MNISFHLNQMYHYEKRPEILDLIASPHLSLVKASFLKICKSELVGSGVKSDKLILLSDLLSSSFII